jgi:uroporphyrinogen decarboxylase
MDMSAIKLRGPTNWSPPPETPEGIGYDEWGVGRKRIHVPSGGYLYEVVHSPLEGLRPEEINLDTYPWPDPHDPGRTAELAEDAQRLYDETDLALMGRFGGTIMEQAFFLRGYTQWLIDLKKDPEFAVGLMNRIADIQIVLDEAGIRAAGKYLSIFKVSGEDLGMQDRGIFSPKVWQENLRPILRSRWQAARDALDRYDATHVKLMLHSDGAIRDYIPDLIKDGIDVIDPVQTSCKGMDVEGLKRDFGEMLSFHGAIDAQHILPFGTPEEVKAEVVRCIKTLGPGGGFILGPVHNVQPDVPPENITAMCQAVAEYGNYPL